MIIYQPERGYRFNSDTLFLYDFIMRFNPRGKVLDVGSGSGILGLLVARDSKIELEAVEKQSDFVFYTKKNAEINDIKISVYHDEVKNLEKHGVYDMIISNPPFYHPDVTQSQEIMLNISRYNTHLPLREFIEKVGKLLNARGRFIFCYDPKQLQEILSELKNRKMRAETIRYVYPNRDRDASLVMISARKSSKSLLKTLPPIFSFDGELFSKEVQIIYKKTATQSISCQL